MRLVIVGAGPAGAACAIAATLAGLHSVTLLDRAAFPREKACGDGLTRDAVELLQALGVAAILETAQPIHGLLVHNLGGSARHIKRYDPRTPHDSAYTLPRAALDHALVRRAQALGTTLLERSRVLSVTVEDAMATGVIVEHDQCEEWIPADAVVCADGATSALRTRLDANRSIRGRGFAVRAYAAGYQPLEPYFEICVPLTFEGRRLPGYGWVFPMPDGRANVGVGVLGVPRVVDSPSARTLLGSFLGQLRTSDPSYSEIQLEGEPMAGALRVAATTPRATPNNVLFIGDAAGLINPFTGEGISGALRTGIIAGSICTRCKQDDLSTEYALRVDELLTPTFRLGESFLGYGGLGWRLLETLAGTNRVFFSRLRDTCLDGDRPRSHVESPGSTPVRHVALPSPILSDSVSGLYHMMPRTLREIYDATAPSTSRSRDTVTALDALELLDILVALQDDVLENDVHLNTPKWANAVPLILADCVWSTALLLGRSIGSAGISAVVEFGAEFSRAGLQLTAPTPDPQVAIRAEITRSSLTGWLLASHLGLPVDERKAAAAICVARRLIWQLGIYEDRSETQNPPELFPWLAALSKSLPALDAWAVMLATARSLCESALMLSRSPLKALLASAVDSLTRALERCDVQRTGDGSRPDPAHRPSQR